jgi:asparagine synthase (glutamine-hydrolysing)
MCGIIGILPADKSGRFKKALDTLIHRGPDDSGTWSSGTDITLGHRRLSILDLSPDGRQPMEDATGRFTIVFNGEIYNFLELKEDLVGKGYVFRSQSDTEVILAAYREWGKDCLLKFNGMWAFAIWDSIEKMLFLARDRFGIKPLFYAFVGEQFIFASEMKAIFPYMATVEPSREIHWLINNIFNYETTDKCVIEGIRRFPLGHFGIYQNGNLKIERYWDTLDHLISIPQDYDKQVEDFREIFIDACKIRMRSDVPIGTALSGGLDSSATISTMAHIGQKTFQHDRISQDWQHAFVATFPGTPLDESYYAKKVVEHLGIDAHYLEIDPLKHWSKIEEYIYLFEDLYITSPIPMIETYQAMREKGVYVTIDGHGADELMAGYGRDLLIALNDCGLNVLQFKNVASAYRDLFEKHEQFQEIDKNLYLKLFFEALLKKLFHISHLNTLGSIRPHIIHALRYPKYSIEIIKKILGKISPQKMPGAISTRRNAAFDSLGSFNKLLYILFHETILPTLLRNYDRYSMINGVEIRMPFMDYRLVSYAFSLPWTSKIRNGYTKKIVRDAVAPFMPHNIAYRKTKIGFNTPIVDWMKNQLRDYFLDEINSSDFKNCPLIDSDLVKKEIEDVIFKEKTTYAQGESAWTRFMPYLWEKSVIKNNGKTRRAYQF